MVRYKRICVVARDNKALEEVRSINLERAFKGSSVSYYILDLGQKPTPIQCDLLIAAGGDGTLFYSLTRLRNPSAHVLHVNLGRKGFLAEIRLADLPKIIGDLQAGNFLLEKVSKISISVGGKFLGEAVNEAALMAKSFKGVVNLSINISEFGSVNILGSGVLIASPLGSTAFSMSAGGPALDNTLKAFVITPILVKRPLVPIVISNQRIIRIKKIGGKEEASLILDGLVEKDLPEGTEAIIKKSNRSVNLIRFEESYLIKRIKRVLTE